MNMNESTFNWVDRLGLLSFKLRKNFGKIMNTSNLQAYLHFSPW